VLLALVLSSIGAFSGAASAAPAAPRPRVALLAGDMADYIADVHDKLVAADAFAEVTTLPESGPGAGTPTLAALQAYDAVYVWTNGPTFSDPVAVGNVLADYIDAGGHVVVSTFAAYSRAIDIRGRFASGGYLPTTTGEQNNAPGQTLVPDIPDHPLLAGVASFDGGTSYRNSGLTVRADSTLVAHWTDGEPFVVLRDKVVLLNFFPPSSDAEIGFWDASTDGTRLMVNALGGVVERAPQFSSTDAATFSAGVGDSVTVTTTGSPKPALTVVGDLPAGVTFTDNADGTATLAGAPDAGTGAAYPVTITATNGIDPEATQDFTLTVTEAPTVTSPETAGFTLGTQGSFEVTTTGGFPTEVTLTLAGKLPEGLTFTDHGDGTATVSGTPALGTVGDHDVTVTAANEAESTTQDITLTVARAAQQVTITSSPPAPNAVVGQTYVVRATGGAAANPIVHSVSEASAGVCTISGTTVTFVHPGTCTVNADQAADADHTAGSATQTVAVAQAATAATAAATADSLSATVTVVAPGAGTPTGTVTFSVGGTVVGNAALTSGTAVLAHQTKPGTSEAVTAVYSGDTDFAGSSASTVASAPGGEDPTITATVRSATAKSAAGWYRTPVQVRFQCTPGSAALVGDCPAPVTVKRNGAGQSVTRTIQAADGGVATVTVRGLNIDRVAPKVQITGITHRTYQGQAPQAACKARDGLSGIARCRVTRHTSGDLVRVVATATDRAGNTSRTSKRYTLKHFYIAGVPFKDGAYQVRAGGTYTVVALTSSRVRPRYFNAELKGRTPTASSTLLNPSGRQAGLYRWTVTVRIDTAAGRTWDMGVLAGGTLHRITFRSHA
jgi:hypothetical protein